MKHFFPVEIHTHTQHSDGGFTPEELIEASRTFGYRGIAITDHNTSSAYQEMIDEKLIPEDFVVLKGMEWTTYFGHLVVIGADYDVDWREARPHTIDDHLREVKAASGLTTIAHPFDVGSPICTGCHWDFQVQDYSLVDQIEIYNSNHPQRKWESQAAYRMWRSLLEEGYLIRASAGRDWHRPDSPDENWAVTYLAVDEPVLTQENFQKALDQGATYFTLGPQMEGFLYSRDQEKVTSGAKIKASEEDFRFTVDFKANAFEDLSSFETASASLHVVHNGQELAHIPVESLELNHSIDLNLGPLSPGYLFWELRGNFGQDLDVLLGLANPIFLS